MFPRQARCSSTAQEWQPSKKQRLPRLSPFLGAQVRGPRGQIFVRGVEVPFLGPGKARNEPEYTLGNQAVKA